MCRRGREGERLGAFLSLPVGGREHDKNSGRQDCGGHKQPAQSFFGKKKLFALGPGWHEHLLVPNTVLGHNKGIFDFLRLALKTYLPSGSLMG